MDGMPGWQHRAGTRRLRGVRKRALLTAFVAALAASMAAPEHASAQFNPFGRKKPHPGQHPGTHRPVHHPAKPKPEHKGPGTDALIARYAGIVLSQPGAQFPLQRLAELYRQRDGNLDKLVAEFEGRAKKSGKGQWNAKVALAGIYKQDGRPQQAIATYKEAIAQRPKDPVAIMALAHLLQDQGDKKAARQRYEQALPYLKASADKEQTLRTLMQLSLDLKDFDAAKKFHRKLVARAKGSFYVRAELGRELLQRGDYQRAVDEYQTVVKAATGDNRVMAPALRDYGRALAKLGKSKKALEVLHRALRLAGGQTGVRRADLQHHRRCLPPRRQARDVHRGAGEAAPERLRAAAPARQPVRGNRPGRQGARRLQEGAEAEREGHRHAHQGGAAASDPGRARRGHQGVRGADPRGAAQPGLRVPAGRGADPARRPRQGAGAAPEARSALEDTTRRRWPRWPTSTSGWKRRTARCDVLKRLAKMGSDPRHLVELGDRYWDEGNKKKALATWKRIKVMVPDRARALDTLGEVYLEHDMSKEALEALKQAMKLAPKNVKYKKAYALALERTGASASGRDGRLRQYDAGAPHLGGAPEGRRAERVPGAGGAAAHRHAVEPGRHARAARGAARAAAEAASRRTWTPDGCSPRQQVRLHRYADAERTLELHRQARAGRRIQPGAARARAGAAAQAAARRSACCTSW